MAPRQPSRASSSTCRCGALSFLGGYAALTLTVASREEIVNLAWDSAGVTTGPVTDAAAAGIGHRRRQKAVSAPTRAGILAIARSIVSVLGTGLWIDAQAQTPQGRDILNNSV